MDVKRTWLEQPIKLVISECWDYLKDDSQLEPEDYVPVITDDSRWYLTYLEGQVSGAFWMKRINLVTWEAHANVRPKFWGNRKGTLLCKMALEEMIRDTGAKKVVALIPASSPAVQRMAEAIGFKVEGVQEKSWMKDGVLYDQTYYGMTGI